MTTPTAGLDITAQLTAVLGRVATALETENAWRQRQMTVIRQVDFTGTITLSGGAGTTDLPDLMMVKTGFMWGVKRLTAQGFSAGTVTAYRNSAAGEPVMPFPAAAVNTLGKGQLLLHSGDKLVWGATGITGTVQFWGSADCFESWYLPYYLG